MIDYIGIIACIELKAEANRARWLRDEDAYYDDFGNAPNLDGWLRRLSGFFQPRAAALRSAGEDCKPAAPPLADRRCQAARL
ncbi:hypothetical protein [Rhizobium sp. BK376]|jgi:hypothetical protein|uniref:hypothetical protein n=1 Tax=Rhizobium sp. BK376 TaxID=2512149 RepID=UPI00104B6D6B|nr:hypothetical protein [Rhizobium sp. BK376]TCR91167.1 hypothetical protein EV561_103564 [Rhizobium sp. BK376]